jgi:hypothetical protein
MGIVIQITPSSNTTHPQQTLSAKDLFAAVPFLIIIVVGRLSVLSQRPALITKSLGGLDLSVSRLGEGSFSRATHALGSRSRLCPFV